MLGEDAEDALLLFVNCCSVGKPKDGDARAAFAVLEESGDGLVPSIERASFDALAVAREMRADEGRILNKSVESRLGRKLRTRDADRLEAA